MRNGIIAGGNWIIDHVKLLDVWPAQDTLANIWAETTSNGGSPCNILKGLARLGARFPLEGIGLVGDDADGRAILDDCRSNGIDASQIAITPAAATSYTDVMTVRDTGRRTFFHQRGANALLDDGHFDFSRTNSRFFHLGYLLLLDRLDEFEGGLPRAVQVLQRARAAGIRTSVDCVSAPSERFRVVVKPVLPHVDVFFANDFETERIVERPLRRDGVVDRAAVEGAGREMLRLGVGSWVVIHFPEAVCACAVSGAAVWQPSVNMPGDLIAGSAGAGDALAAGVLLGLHDNKPMHECLRLGVCAAASSLSDPTCTGGILPAAECIAASERLGFHPLPA